MQRWEYLQHDLEWPKMAGEVRNLPQLWDALEISKNGWELVSTVRTPSGTITSLFKRPVVEQGTARPAPPDPPTSLAVEVRKKKGGRA